MAWPPPFSSGTGFIPNIFSSGLPTQSSVDSGSFDSSSLLDNDGINYGSTYPGSQFIGPNTLNSYDFSGQGSAYGDTYGAGDIGGIDDGMLGTDSELGDGALGTDGSLDDGASGTDNGLDDETLGTDDGLDDGTLGTDDGLDDGADGLNDDMLGRDGSLDDTSESTPTFGDVGSTLDTSGDDDGSDDGGDSSDTDA